MDGDGDEGGCVLMLIIRASMCLYSVVGVEINQ